MKKVYLDNAATTAVRPEVISEMVKVLQEDYGNASSSHSFGRHTKSLLELSRKSIAKQLNASAQEIIFTSGGTEADNWIIHTAVKDLKVQRIITSKIEHHAVLHTVEAVEKEFGVRVDFVRTLPNGAIDIMHLADLLSENIPTLVTLMHVNNEIGTVLDLEKVGALCKQYHAYFHSDTIQSIGKTTFDLLQIPIDFIVASAHKFHGPKGIGFVFVRKGLMIHPMIFGGEQEKGLRAGTEAVHNIVGMARALELSHANLEVERQYIADLKAYAIAELQTHFPGVKINGDGGNVFYNIVNACFPFTEEKTAMILFHLDMKGIAVSRGSACQSGSIKPSHVLSEILSANDIQKPSLRISFSHTNTKEDVDYLVEVLKSV
ncbi:MAG TPA: cysteine desulfurase family protein [Flavobacterium sp.]|nr:cysteine desulfurase family protein [Flavobacterium sp.]